MGVRLNSDTRRFFNHAYKPIYGTYKMVLAPNEKPVSGNPSDDYISQDKLNAITSNLVLN
jgi:hypothetical protein